MTGAPYDEFRCERCEHGPHWHRLDDRSNISPNDPEAKFRCLGVDFGGCDVACLDFVRPPGYDEALARQVDQEMAR
jgi:hypothetical protein